MKRRTPILFLASLFGAVACGGMTTESSPTEDAGRKRDGGRDGAVRDQASEPAQRIDANTGDVFYVFPEDACTDAPLEVPPVECDPFATSPCPAGRACYPIPPRATDPCRPGRYGTKCLTAGRGMQGAPCGDGTDCAGGFICVKTGAGDQCVKLCRLKQFGSCIDGRICREVDITGSEWGGCE